MPITAAPRRPPILLRVPQVWLGTSTSRPFILATVVASVAPIPVGLFLVSCHGCGFLQFAVICSKGTLFCLQQFEGHTAAPSIIPPPAPLPPPPSPSPPPPPPSVANTSAAASRQMSLTVACVCRGPG